MKMKFLVLPLIAATMLCAQGPRGFGRAAGGTPPTPAQIAQRDVNRLTKFLTLTTAQQSSILATLTTAITNLQANAPTLKTDRDALMAAVKAGNTGAISAAFAPGSAMTTLQSQQEVIRLNAAAAIWAQLDSTQQAKVSNVMSLVDGGGMGFRGMRPMGPPPGAPAQ